MFSLVGIKFDADAEHDVRAILGVFETRKRATDYRDFNLSDTQRNYYDDYAIESE